MSQKPEDTFQEDLAASGVAPARRGWGARLGGLFRRRAPAAAPPPVGGGGRWRRTILLGVGGLVILFVLYMAVGAFVVHTVDDDPDFAVASPLANGSKAVEIAAALIERETGDAHRWTANDPFFLPGSLLDNMPNYQQGIIYALSRFTAEMGDQIGRSRGSSQVDPDLDRATGLLRYPGTIWLFDLSTSWAPTASSESQYRAAARALRSYNERVAAGTAPFERRADNLLQTVDRFAADLGSQSSVIADHIEASRGWLIDTRADDIFYSTKGRLYAYFLVMRALGQDFDGVLAQSGATKIWAEMVDNLREAAELQPLVVMNGRADAMFQPNHLAAQGFFLLRARTQMRELSNVLRN
ncbi:MULTISPECIES: DUF2333 family protein [Inquilinus]|uniref:DUF2333 family protein n=1 Tax=Inquilinus ginsengisoli TaxID=363840 RepID=A0ABU1JGY8_9PROT|nr:DUF2333 family protein [Inquilinus ginsengisoli]MDR6287887.1 hypothetical protein [Inquilinus ginsengisoli]